MFLELMGYVAGALTTVSFLPQVLKAWKSRSTKDVSLGMFVLFTMGIFLWLVYGIYKGDMPILIANLITLVLASLMLGMKLKYG